MSVLNYLGEESFLVFVLTTSYLLLLRVSFKVKPYLVEPIGPFLELMSGTKLIIKFEDQ